MKTHRDVYKAIVYALEDHPDRVKPQSRVQHAYMLAKTAYEAEPPVVFDKLFEGFDALPLEEQITYLRAAVKIDQRVCGDKRFLDWAAANATAIDAHISRG